LTRFDSIRFDSIRFERGGEQQKTWRGN
jgi:hypothetical protein